MLSQTLSVPVFESAESFPRTWTGSNPRSLGGWMELRAEDSPCSLLVNSQAGSSSNGISTPATSVPTWPGDPAGSSSIAAQQAGSAASGEAAQLRRSIERLKLRNQRAEGEIEELRDASRAARTDLVRADDILEALMDSGDVSGKVYESLAELSKLLASVSGRLRKGG